MTRMRVRSKVSLAGAVAVLLTLSAPSARAQEELVTDRPDQTESAVTVAPGKVQIETGVLFTRLDLGREKLDITEALGTLVRIGLLERLELRVGFDGYVSVRGASGLGDASLGAKVLLAEETENRPQMALLFGTSVPVGDDRFTSDDYEASARLALSKTFDEVGVGFNLSTEFPTYTLAAGMGLDEVNGVFVELFGDESNHSFDAGWTRLVRPNLQFDVSAGLGISDRAPDWFAGVGVSVRLPR